MWPIAAIAASGYSTSKESPLVKSRQPLGARFEELDALNASAVEVDNQTCWTTSELLVLGQQPLYYAGKKGLPGYSVQGPSDTDSCTTFAFQGPWEAATLNPGG